MTYTGATLAALLRDVLDAPDDDDARLRYADRLDELGDAEHAEFVRMGISLALAKEDKCSSLLGMLAGYPIVSTNCDCGECSRRRLLQQYVDSMAPTLTLPLAFMVCEDIGYSRGFVDSITLTASDWFAHADAILAAHPVREVTLTTWPKVEREDESDPYDRRRLSGRKWWTFDELACDDFLTGVVWRLLRAEWPTVAEWHLPAEMDENGGYVVPEHLAPAVEAMHASGGVLHGPIHQLPPPGWTP